MKKEIKVCLLGMVVVLVAGMMTGCSNKKDTGSTAETENVSTETTQAFTVDDLKNYDGKDGNPAYVAIDGIVYDVTNANGWNNGEHQNGAKAGQDLTEVLSSSPHGDSVLGDLMVVGTLE